MHPISDALNDLLDRSLTLRASDVHLTAGVEPYMRSDQGLVKVSDARLSAGEIEEMAFSLMNEQQRELYRRDLSLDIAFFSRSGQRFRANVFRQRGSHAIILRRLDEVFRSFDDLNLPPQVAEAANYSHGLVLVTGQTGSGKSTTLAAIVHLINCTRPCHIITIEDPVEYIHQNQMGLVHQREVRTDVPCFASAVRAALREDPDVILVGEMRDLETMRAAITAAETGHLVFSTLHTGDVVGTMGRLISVFPAEEQRSVRDQLSRVLRAAISQKLLPRADQPGRAPVIEVLRVNEAVANLIRNGDVNQLYSVMQSGAADGMLLLEQCLADLTARGLIKYDDALTLARERSILDSRLQVARDALKAAGPAKRRFSLLRA